MSLDVTARMPNSSSQTSNPAVPDGVRLAEQLGRAVKDIRSGSNSTKIQVYKLRLDALRFAALMAAGSADVARGRSIARQIGALARELRSLGEEAVASGAEQGTAVLPPQPAAAEQASDALQLAATTMGILRRAQWRRQGTEQEGGRTVDIES